MRFDSSLGFGYCFGVTFTVHKQTTVTEYGTTSVTLTSWLTGIIASGKASLSSFSFSLAMHTNEEALKVMSLFTTDHYNIYY